jgi:hypothetical protein
MDGLRKHFQQLEMCFPSISGWDLCLHSSELAGENFPKLCCAKWWGDILLGMPMSLLHFWHTLCILLLKSCDFMIHYTTLSLKVRFSPKM